MRPPNACPSFHRVRGSTPGSLDGPQPLPISLSSLQFLLTFYAPPSLLPCLSGHPSMPGPPAGGKSRDSLPGPPPGQSAAGASNNLSYFVEPNTGNDISWPIKPCAGGLGRQPQVLVRPCGARRVVGTDPPVESHLLWEGFPSPSSHQIQGG